MSELCVYKFKRVLLIVVLFNNNFFSIRKSRVNPITGLFNK